MRRSGFFWVLLIAGWPYVGGPAGGAQTADTAADHLPKKLKVSWTSMSRTPFTFRESCSAEWDGKALHYEVSYEENVKKTVTPSEASWTEFWKEVDEVGLWKWRDRYTGADVKDALTWGVEVEWGGNKVASSGKNSAPSDFPRFQRAVEKLLTVYIEVGGTYWSAFEASRFRPSTEKYRMHLWWLSGNKDFNDRYERLGHEPGPRFFGPKVLVRMRGRLFGPGKYGHLGRYDYEFIVDQVLEMKLPPTPDKLKLAEYWARSAYYSVEWDGKVLKYKVDRSSFPMEHVENTVIPCEAAWNEFWKKMDELQVWKWQQSYTKHGMLGGRAWNVEIECGSRKVKCHGSNSWPSDADVTKPDEEAVSKVFQQFQQAVAKLVGEEFEQAVKKLLGEEGKR